MEGAHFGDTLECTTFSHWFSSEQEWCLCGEVRHEDVDTCVPKEPRPGTIGLDLNRAP